MIRGVLDTNTLISAFFWGGVPGHLYDVASEEYTLLTSDAMLEELLTVLQRPKFADKIAKKGRSVVQLMAAHRQVAEIVKPVEISDDVVRDPKDRIVLECAVGGQADYIVSGDKDLLTLERYENISIINAAQFLDKLGSESA